jgi:hypothetical protein
MARNNSQYPSDILYKLKWQLNQWLKQVLMTHILLCRPILQFSDGVSTEFYGNVIIKADFQSETILKTPTVCSNTI